MPQQHAIRRPLIGTIQENAGSLPGIPVLARHPFPAVQENAVSPRGDHHAAQKNAMSPHIDVSTHIDVGS